MKPRLRVVIRCLLAGVLFCGLVQVTRATNLVQNGSFEAHWEWWNFPGAVGFSDVGQVPDGVRYVEVITSLWQDIPTEPGVTYYLRFSTKTNYVPGVSFAGQPVTMVQPYPSYYFSWFYLEAFVTATGSVSRLQFTTAGHADDVRLIDTREPLRIVSQPESRSGIEGGAASFSVVVEGGPPITYQWQFNSNSIAGATNAALFLTNLGPDHVGTYCVLVSNWFGFIQSSNAVLTVEHLPKAPTLVRQPEGDTLPAGYAYTLGVVALGDEPLSYQWMLDGAVLADATNRSLHFPSIQSSNNGVYSVRVENHLGSVLSLPTTIHVTNSVGGGGRVEFSNLRDSVSRRPIYDVDGVTKLSGSNYLAQLYAGPTPTVLRAIAEPAPFKTAPFAGFFAGPIATLPDVAPGQTAFVQIRVWESAAGVSYEDSRARGGKYGASPVQTCIATSPAQPPAPVPMVSFNLRAGTPLFSTGAITVHNRTQGSPIEWRLTGAAASRYLVESRRPPQDWVPLMVLTNTSGTVFFTDTNETSGALNFYRARMLD